MHERAAVAAELDVLMVETGGDVSRVLAAVGPGVDQQVVRGIWEEKTAGTPAASADLVLDSAGAVLRCLVCGTDYEGAKLDPCPVCSGDGLVISAPPEFEIRSWVEGA